MERLQRITGALVGGHGGFCYNIIHGESQNFAYVGSDGADHQASLSLWMSKPCPPPLAGQEKHFDYSIGSDQDLHPYHSISGFHWCVFNGVS